MERRPFLAAALTTGAGIGANIGWGLMIIVGGPLMALLLLWIIGWSLHVLRSARRGQDGLTSAS
jgi:hypothetical protein